MIKAVVVDLGGVLFSEGKAVAREYLASRYNYDPNLVDSILASPKSILLRKGLVTDEEFWQWAQQQLPSDYDCRIIRQAWYNGYVLDDDIYALIAKLKKNYVTIAFSGNIKSRVDFLEKKYRFRHLFDIEVYSFDYHMTKPERGFVEVMIRKSGVTPAEIVYIDDNDSYAKPARELGVHVIIYRRGEVLQLSDALRRCGVTV